MEKASHTGSQLLFPVLARALSPFFPFWRPPLRFRLSPVLWFCILLYVLLRCLTGAARDHGGIPSEHIEFSAAAAAADSPHFFVDCSEQPTNLDDDRHKMSERAALSWGKCFLLVCTMLYCAFLCVVRARARVQASKRQTSRLATATVTATGNTIEMPPQQARQANWPSNSNSAMQLR